MNASPRTDNTVTVAVGGSDTITLQLDNSEQAVIRLEVVGNSCCHHPHSATQPGSYTYIEPTQAKS